MQVTRQASDGRVRLSLLPPGGLQSLESAFSLLLALQTMRSELQASKTVTTPVHTGFFRASVVPSCSCVS